MTNWTGTDGDNSKTGGAGSDFFDGKGGDDTLHGAGGGDMLQGGLGADKVYGEAGDDTLYGGGSESPDLLDGGEGDDWTQGSATDTLIGGAGVDEFVLDMSMAAGAVNVNLGRLAQGLTVTFADGTQLSGYESGDLHLGAGSDFVRIGDSGTFEVLGGGGNDTILAGSGDDWMVGGLGDDRLEGGAGVDWVAYFGAERGVRVSLAAAGPQNTRGAGVDTLAGFENLQGGSYNDQLVGNAGDNHLWGAFGGDYLTETGDTLVGGAGNDTLESGGYWALMKGGAGNDQLGYADFWYYYNEADYQTLVGGKGQDAIFLNDGSVAVFETLKDSTVGRPDRIMMREFSYQTEIDLHLIDADSTLAGNQAFTLVSAFSRHAGELVVSRKALEGGGFDTWVLMDVDGDGRADSRIILTGDRATFDDFIF